MNVIRASVFKKKRRKSEYLGSHWEGCWSDHPRCHVFLLKEELKKADAVILGQQDKIIELTTKLAVKRA